jgi:hypothetical protein
MWERADILALLQLITMLVIAAIHALSYFLTHECPYHQSFPLLSSILTSRKSIAVAIQPLPTALNSRTRARARHRCKNTMDTRYMNREGHVEKMEMRIETEVLLAIDE